MGTIGLWRPAQVSVRLALALLLAILVSPAGRSQDSPSYVGAAACRICHRNVVSHLVSTPHEALAAEDDAGPGKGCEACHGPGSEHVGNPMDVKPPELATLPPLETARTCGACHFPSRQPGGSRAQATIDDRGWFRLKHHSGGISCLHCHAIHPEDAAEELKASALVAEAQTLCEMCHLDQKEGDNAHFPIAQGECLQCHDPHGGGRRYGLLGEVLENCELCHDPSDEGAIKSHGGFQFAGSDCLRCHSAHSRDVEGHRLKANLHFPFAQGQCEICHQPADQSPKAALIADERELCYACHDKGDVVPKKATVVHLPVEQGTCSLCHEPHASDTEHKLRYETRAVCGTCHPHEELRSLNSPHGHKPAMEGDCSVCHNPHATKDRKLLLASTDESCSLGGCHKESPRAMHKTGENLTVPRTSKVVSVYCSSCHNPHGGRYPLLADLGLDKDQCLTCHPGMGGTLAGRPGP